ncbi:MAG: hypothetical protein ABFC62_10250 [Clostridiaceae bacterium]
MKRAWALTAVFAMCAALALLFSACASGGAAASDAEPVRILPSVSPESTAIPPLTITRGLTSNGEGIMLYPRIEGENAVKINTSIESDLNACVGKTTAQVFTTYKITTNSNGLLSAVLDVRDLKTGELLQTLSFNYDVKTGDKLCIADYFDTENDRWRRVLPDIVALQAQDKGLTLLCDVMPVTDEQLYYISGEALVLMYRQYEIATYADPLPQFSIPVSQLAEFLPEDSLLTRLNSTRGGEAVTVSPTPQETVAAQAGVSEAAAETTPEPTPGMARGADK